MAKLYYFDGRGRGELIRLALAVAEIEYTEVILTERDQMVQLMKEGKLAFNQLPLLEIDGKCLVQSLAIVRYIGRKAGLYGKTEDEQVRVDIYFDAARDFITPILPIGFLPEEAILTKVKTETIPKYAPLFEKILAANDTGYLVGDAMTIADISLLEALLVFVEYLGIEIFDDYPSILRFYKVMTKTKSIADFLEGPLRKRKNDERYVKEVMRVLDKSLV